MIRVSNLTKRFASHVALDDISFQVDSGQLYTLLGPNGAGKSTTLACILGFERGDSGEVEVNGVDVATDPAIARQHLAYIPEQVSLYESFSAIENVAFFASLSGTPRSPAELRSLLLAAGLQESAHARRTATYSKGMRQKVGIAIALAKNARALLLDEPTSGLDPASAHEFGASLRRLRDSGTAILVASHDLYRTLEDADRIGILVGGRLVEERDTSALRAHDLERLYLGSVANGAVGSA